MVAMQKFMRILVCGSRTITDPDQKDYIRTVLEQGYGRYEVLIQGDCPTGADSVAKAWAWKRGVPTADFPADWKAYGKSAGPRRNAQMLEEGDPHIVLAFVDKPLEESRGTLNMVSLARKHPTHPVVHVYRTDLKQKV